MSLPQYKFSRRRSQGLVCGPSLLCVGNRGTQVTSSSCGTDGPTSSSCHKASIASHRIAGSHPAHTCCDASCIHTRVMQPSKTSREVLIKLLLPATHPTQPPPGPERCLCMLNLRDSQSQEASTSTTRCFALLWTQHEHDVATLGVGSKNKKLVCDIIVYRKPPLTRSFVPPPAHPLVPGEDYRRPWQPQCHARVVPFLHGARRSTLRYGPSPVWPRDAKCADRS